MTTNWKSSVFIGTVNGRFPVKQVKYSLCCLLGLGIIRSKAIGLSQSERAEDESHEDCVDILKPSIQTAVDRLNTLIGTKLECYGITKEDYGLGKAIH